MRILSLLLAAGLTLVPSLGVGADGTSIHRKPLVDHARAQWDLPMIWAMDAAGTEAVMGINEQLGIIVRITGPVDRITDIEMGLSNLQSKDVIALFMARLMQMADLLMPGRSAESKKLIMTFASEAQKKPKNSATIGNVNLTSDTSNGWIVRFHVTPANGAIARFKAQADEDGFADWSRVATAIRAANPTAEIEYSSSRIVTVTLYDEKPTQDIIRGAGDATLKVLAAIPKDARGQIEQLSIHTVIRTDDPIARDGRANATTARWNNASLKKANLTAASGLDTLNQADALIIMPAAVKQARTACQQPNTVKRYPKICAEAR